MGWYSLTLPLTVTSLQYPTPSIHTISFISLIITVLIYEIFLRNPNYLTTFFYPQHFCTHPATLKDTKFFPHIQGKSMTICQAYTNYIIFNEIELLLKNPYITALPYWEYNMTICQVGVKPYKNGLKKKIFKPRRGARALTI